MICPRRWILFLQVDAEQAILSSHVKAPLTEGHRAPEFEVKVLFKIASENICRGKLAKASFADFPKAQYALFSVLNYQHAIGVKACASSHEGVVSRTPQFFAIKGPTAQSPGFTLCGDSMIRVLIGEKIEMVGDNEGRVNLGSFLDGPLFTQHVAVPLSLNGKHLGSTVVAPSSEEKSIADLGHGRNRNPVIVMGGLPQSFSVVRSIAGNKALLTSLIYYCSQDDVLFSCNLQQSGRGV